MAHTSSLLDFYKNRRVLITGNTGFKGAWLSLWLQKMGAQVYGISLDVPSNPSLFERAGLKGSMPTTFLDINDYSKLKAAFDEAQPEFLFHLAAQSLVRPSYDEPLKTFATNTMGTAHILECCRNPNSLKSVLVVTSDKCYQNTESGKPFSENDPMGGDDPYSASKGAAEIVFHSYFKSFFQKSNSPAISSVRAGNVIGGGDWAVDRIIPDAIRAWGSQQKLEIRSPNSIRPWQHVLEPLYGYLLTAKTLVEQKSLSGESYNFGPGRENEKTVLELISKLSEHCSFSEGWDINTHQKSDKKEAQVLRLNSEKAKSQLKWKNHLDFSETLAWTGQWYSETKQKPEQLRALTLKQIEDFEAKINKD